MAFYALYLLVEQNQEKEFSALISDFSNARGKNDLSTFEAKFLIESIDNYLHYSDGPLSINLMHKIFALFGLIPVKSFKGAKLQKLYIIFSSIMENFNDNILKFKKMEHYKETNAGLKVFILLCKQDGLSEYLMPLKLIRDYNHLFNFLVYIIENAELIGTSIDKNDIDLMTKRFDKITLTKKEKLITSLINSLKNMSLILEILSYCDENFIRKNEFLIQKFISRSSLFDASPREILEILKKIEIFPIINEIFKRNNYLNIFIKKNLKDDTNISESSIESYLQLFEYFESSENYKKFDHQEITRSFITKLGFSSSKKLILLDTEKIPNYFNEWLSKLGRGYEDITKAMDNELNL